MHKKNRTFAFLDVDVGEDEAKGIQLVAHCSLKPWMPLNPTDWVGGSTEFECFHSAVMGLFQLIWFQPMFRVHSAQS